MTTISFETGQTVDFDGSPTPQDIEEVATRLGISKQPPATPQTFGQKIGGAVDSASQFLVKNNVVGNQIGQAVGNNLFGANRLLHGDIKGFDEAADSVGKIGPKRLFGDATKAVVTPVSLALSPTKTVLGSAAQFGALGSASSAGESLSQGDSFTQAGVNAIKGGGINALTGGVFNLLGKGGSKLAKSAGPSLFEFTTGVPKKATSQAAMNPEIAKAGLNLPVSEILQRAEKAHQSLKNDLGNEFATGLEAITKNSGQTKKGVVFNKQGFQQGSKEIQRLLVNYGRDFAREFRIGSRMTPAGAVLDFSKSPVVSPGEMRNVQETFNTISSWSDFSARGMQDLAERVGALRKFESGAHSESSAIISKVYNRITGSGSYGQNALIPKYVPELAKLRTNFAKNKETLDTIGAVLNSSKIGPTSQQSAVSRLDNLFKENRDVYLNAVEELGKRSGIDVVSLLAGAEHQKILPDYIRGIGGAATVGAGTGLVSPWAILLSPLFSPRFAGLVSRNASKIGRATSQVARFGATQATRGTTPKQASQQGERTLP